MNNTTPSIEVVINGMINKCYELGRNPSELRLTAEDHDELLKKTTQYTGPVVSVVEDGVTYRPHRQIQKLTEYQGIRVVIGDETKVLWQ